METFTWIAIIFCVSQSAMFSGLNLALFSITRLRLEVEASTGDENAQEVLNLRKDSNFLLATVLWGNVGVNVLLTLLSNSVMAGTVAFFFSTFVITIFGEIIPQAYFSRHALRIASLLLPLFKLYQTVLSPITRPSAKLLDWWLGHEGIQFFREHDMREVIRKHIEAEEADIDRLEGLGALNFLEMDDLLVSEEGELVDPKSILKLPATNGFPAFPQFERTASDPFLTQLEKSGKKWVIISDESGEPQLILDSDGFLRAALFDSKRFHPYNYCHRPIIVKDPRKRLGEIIGKLKVYPKTVEDDVVDHDVILIWCDEKRVITGADILGRLLRGIVTRSRKSS
jgi:metal transporter CNNM